MSIDQAIQDLVEKGAALAYVNQPGPAVGVAWWRRVNANLHLYWAPGLSDFDQHPIHCASEQIHYDGLAVSFHDKAGEMTAYLTLIQEAEYNEEQAKILAEQIAWWKKEFETNEYFRASVLEAYQRAGTW
ncbi:MAG: hypothetical protein RIQ93_1659 [Verrucomicrobiota bacterium]|jgi:hypothetical protein